MGLEATSYDWLRGGIRKALPGYALLERIENGLAAGTADINYVIRGVEGWIEMKAVDLPKRDGTKVLGDKGVNLEQINWHLARQAVGGRTWVFISAAPYRWLVSGCYVKVMNDWSREKLSECAHVWHNGKWAEGHWQGLLRALQR